jgi:hypothetical protein
MNPSALRALVERDGVDLVELAGASRHFPHPITASVFSFIRITSKFLRTPLETGRPTKIRHVFDSIFNTCIACGILAVIVMTKVYGCFEASAQEHHEETYA